MPPSDPTILLTRPAEQSAVFAGQLNNQVPGLHVVISPLAEIRFRDLAGRLTGVRGLVFTSQNAVAAYAKAGGELGLTAWCVGERTAEAARAIGLRAISADGDAEALLTLLLRERPETPLVHLRGEHTRGEVAERLSRAGLETRQEVAYEQRALPLTPEAVMHLRGSGTVLAPLFSPRSARLFRQAAKGALARLELIAISPAAAAELVDWPGTTVHVAARPDSTAVLERLVSRIAALRLP